MKARSLPAGDRGTIVGAYMRIRDAAEKGRGVRLSAHEVETIWLLDASVSQTVWSAEQESDERERQHGR